VEAELEKVDGLANAHTVVIDGRVFGRVVIGSIVDSSATDVWFMPAPKAMVIRAGHLEAIARAMRSKEG